MFEEDPGILSERRTCSVKRRDDGRGESVWKKPSCPRETAHSEDVEI